MLHSDFWMWWNQGWQHIISLSALDHILYVVALCLAFTTKDWKKILLLITAFTIGHCATLILVSVGVIDINTKWVEICIPITIAITALLNIIRKNNKQHPLYIMYSFALFFGLIHGMAYGVNSISSLYNNNEVLPLTLAFNLGVEVGQIAIVIATLYLNWAVTKQLGFNEKIWRIFLSSIILVYAIYLAINNIP
jgi:hydrogenase/urease accessory protein HupE